MVKNSPDYAVCGPPQVLSLGDFASHRLPNDVRAARALRPCLHRCVRLSNLAPPAHCSPTPQAGLALFCKPHFRQNFLDSGGRYGAPGANAAPAGAVASGPSGIISPYKPSCEVLFSDDEESHTPAAAPVRATPTKNAKDFESGFEPEWKPQGAKSMVSSKCAKCAAKVFPICKLELPDGGGVYHVDCFRCAICTAQLSLQTSEVGKDGSLRCMKHAITDKP